MLEWPDLLRLIQDANHIWCQLYLYVTMMIVIIPIDKKFKKSSEPGRLKRVRNIEANPNVALLIDEYTEDWAKLYFIMIQGIVFIGR